MAGKKAVNSLLESGRADIYISGGLSEYIVFFTARRIFVRRAFFTSVISFAKAFEIALFYFSKIFLNPPKYTSQNAPKTIKARSKDSGRF